jgi:hypothetical protein
MSKLQTPIFLLFFLLLAACTAAVEPPVVERPTADVVTLTPYAPEPINTSTPIPQSFYEDAWLGGFLLNSTELQVGNSSLPHVLTEGQIVPLQTADAETAEHLNSLPTGDVVVWAEGNFHYNGPEDYWLEVDTIEPLNLPYSSETPLDATYNHSGPDFTFDYPSGWFIRPSEDDPRALLQLSNVPPIVYEKSLWVGREFVDPTQYEFTILAIPAESAAEFRATATEIDEAGPGLKEVEMVTLNGRSVTRVVETSFGTTALYLVDINGQLLVFTDWGPQTDFMERIIATLR